MKKLLLPALAAVILVGCGQSDNPAPSSVAADIWTAAALGDTKAIESFLADGMDVNAVEPTSGATPLIAAALTGQTTAAGFLLEKGADIEAKNNEGSTALLVAAFFAHPETVQLLIEKGADLNVKNQDGATPLDAVSGEWNDEVAGLYEFIAGLMEVEVDLDRIKADRPKVAALLREHGAKSASG